MAESAAGARRFAVGVGPVCHCPPFIYVDRDAFLDDEAKYQYELEHRMSLNASGVVNGSVQRQIRREFKSFNDTL